MQPLLLLINSLDLCACSLPFFHPWKSQLTYWQAAMGIGKGDKAVTGALVSYGVLYVQVTTFCSPTSQL
jgi:hypothetical protein